MGDRHTRKKRREPRSAWNGCEGIFGVNILMGTLLWGSFSKNFVQNCFDPNNGINNQNYNETCHWDEISKAQNLRCAYARNHPRCFRTATGLSLCVGIIRFDMFMPALMLYHQYVPQKATCVLPTNIIVLYVHLSRTYEHSQTENRSKKQIQWTLKRFRS